jgi:hypothetical protein
MAQPDIKPVRAADGWRSSPWPFLLAGIVAATLAVPLTLADHRLEESASAYHGMLLSSRLLLILLAVLSAGTAVARQARSALVLGLAALVLFTATYALDKEWDTVIVLFRVATIVALTAGILVLLPQWGRRAAISVMVLFHFGGILTAVGNVPSPGGDAPWLVTQLWARVYRPYLQFMYLTNAYHFYAPDPGPPCFLWFHVEYADGSARWVRIPDREEHAKDPFALQFYRRLPITESTNQLLPPMPIPNDIALARVMASHRDGIPTPNEIGQIMPAVYQHRIPTDYSKRLLRTYARHVANSNPHSDGQTPLRGVKVYRVVHAILSPGEFAAGASVVDPTVYWPYFQGEFDGDGNLKNPNDPYLYWLIPIIKVATVSAPVPGAPLQDAAAAQPQQEIRDYVAIHASLRR